jgi:molecular chaperone DnaK (HSP70)
MSKITDILDRLLKNSMCTKSQITTVLLTGKSSYIPKIQETIQKYFSMSPNKPEFVFPIPDSESDFHPKDCVSNGAGVWVKLKDNQTFEIYEKEIPPTFTYQNNRAKMITIFSKDDKIEKIYRKTLKYNQNPNFRVFDEKGELYHEFSFDGIDGNISSFDIVFEKPELYIEINGKKINTNR